MNPKKWYRYCPKCKSKGRCNGTRPSTKDTSTRTYYCSNPKCPHSWDVVIEPVRIVKVVSKLELIPPNQLNEAS
jgi:hypothetical protein